MENPLDNLPESNQGFTAQDNHNHDGLNSPLIDPVNLPGGGLSLVKYIETPANSISFTSLDPTVNGYHLIVEFDSGSFQDTMRLRFNNDSTANIYYEGYEFESGSPLSGSGAFDYLPLSIIGCNAAQLSLHITKPPALNYLINGTGAVQIGKQPDVQTANFRTKPLQLAGAYFGSTITSINLYALSGTQAMNWKAWLYKLNTK